MKYIIIGIIIVAAIIFGALWYRNNKKKGEEVIEAGKILSERLKVKVGEKIDDLKK